MRQLVVMYKISGAIITVEALSMEILDRGRRTAPLTAALDEIPF